MVGEQLLVPVLGVANAGFPTALAEENYDDSLKLDINMFKVPQSDLYALVVSGDSMNLKLINGTSISDGSYVIIAKESEIRDGDTVVAIINGAATIKTYKKFGDSVVLYPESTNLNHKPIYVDINTEMQINGRVVKVLANESAHAGLL